MLMRPQVEREYGCSNLEHRFSWGCHGSQFLGLLCHYSGGECLCVYDSGLDSGFWPERTENDDVLVSYKLG